MLKNKEFKVYLVLCLLISLSGLLGLVFLPAYNIIIYVLVVVMLLTISVCYTKYRYKKVQELSDYLKKVQNKEYTLDLRDHEEGELSILKSEIYKVTLMLTEQAELLQKDKVYLADAISDISHQLKTPLTSMMMMADLLKDEKLPVAKRYEFTRNIHVQLERIDWLVSSLLKMSKLDVSTVILKKERVDVKELIKQATSHLFIPMEIKEQTLEIQGDLDITLLCDFNWMKEAIANIIKNCMEHTSALGTITIHVDDNSVFTSIRIKDTGEGIAREDLPYIFNRFYKGKNASSDSIGIGLALSKQIIHLQGGRIEASSEEGIGSTFSIKIYKRVV